MRAAQAPLVTTARPIVPVEDHPRRSQGEVNMSVLVIYLVVWILLGLLVGALAGLIGSGQPPYGLAVDVCASVLAMVAVGMADYAVLPLLGYEGTLRFIAMVAEPLITAVIVLWLLRVIKRRRSRGETL
jgi:uncharacterized membrane protein YeaQ/YmgE (transglycosylase-associated protein family)